MSRTQFPPSSVLAEAPDAGKVGFGLGIGGNKTNMKACWAIRFISAAGVSQ